jgi:hypothetical protein
MLIFDLEQLETLDKTSAIKGGATDQGLFSFNASGNFLEIRDHGIKIYQAAFPLPIGFSFQNIPGTITSGSGQSPDGSVKTSYIALAGQGIQGSQKIAVFFSSSSSVLSLA